jgi:hypothetical protein
VLKELLNRLVFTTLNFLPNRLNGIQKNNAPYRAKADILNGCITPLTIGVHTVTKIVFSVNVQFLNLKVQISVKEHRKTQ